MPHSQQDGASPVEIGLFMDQYLRVGKPLPHLGVIKRHDDTVAVSVSSPVPIRKAEFRFTTDTGVWEQRRSQTREARISGRTIAAGLPAARPLTHFISVTDERGASVTTEYEQIEK